MLFALGVIGAAAAGLITSKSLTDDYRSTTCSFFEAVDTIEYGNITANWTGINGAAVLLLNLKSLFSANFGNSSYDNSSVSSVTSTSTTLHNTLVTSYGTASPMTVPSANPTPSSATIVPDIIAKAGPLTNAATWYGAIDNERTTYEDAVTNSSTYLEKDLTTVTSNLATYQNNIDTGSERMSGMDRLFAQVDNTFYSITNQGDTIVSHHVRLGLLSMFAIAIGMSSLTLICPICICLFKKRWCNGLVWLAWESLASLMLVCFIIGVVSLVVGIVITQGCDVLYQSVTTSGYLTGVTSFISSDSQYVQYINTCLFGDGDILTSVGVKDTFSVINNVYGELNTLSPYFRSKAGATSVNIPLFETALTNTISGKNLLVTDSSNVDGTTYNLVKMNQISDSNAQGSIQSSTYTSCTSPVQDQWVMNFASCSSGYTDWTSPDNNNIGSKTCLQVPDTVVPATRYAGTGCGAGFTTAVSSYKTSLDSQFTNGAADMNTLKTDLTGTVQTAWDNFADAIYTATDPASELKTNLTEIFTIVSDPSTGLTYNMNCGFFKDSFTNFHNTMCTGLVVTFYQITLSMLILATFACFTSFFLFFFAKYTTVHLEYQPSPNDAQAAKYMA